MTQKKFLQDQGLVATAGQSLVPRREIFIAVEPKKLDIFDPQAIQDMRPSGQGIKIDVEPLLQFLPEEEQEIFFLSFVKRKDQKDIARLLGYSQPTVSYRYRRVVEKLSYLMILAPINTRELIDDLDFLRDKEKDILFDLLYYTNQELVGKKHETRQSSVKWILVKTKRRLRDRELQEPERWHRHYGLIMFLEKNLGIRVLH